MPQTTQNQPLYEEESFSFEIKRELTGRPPRKNEASKAVMDGIIDSVGVEARLPDLIVDYIEKLLQKDGVDLYGSDGIEYVSSEFGRYYLRGVFLACGYASNPNKRHRIELHIKNEDAADTVEALLKRDELEFAKSTKGNTTVIYLRKADSVSDFLGIIGANTARLEMESIRTEKEVISNVMRSVNFDTANTTRQVEAGIHRNELVKKLMDSSDAQSLKPELKMAAEVILANPGSSISELGKLMDPPIGKSGMNHRIQKLLEIAKSLD